MAQQACLEDGETGSVRLEGEGGAGLNGPARRGGARPRPGRDADEKRRHAGLACGERQAAGGGEIEQAGLAPGLQEHGAERSAAQGLGARAQDARGVRNLDQDQAVGMEPEFHEAGRMKQSRLAIDRILPHPGQRCVMGGPQGQGRRKTGSRRRIGRRLRMDLVQRPPREAAPESLVEIGCAAREKPMRRGRESLSESGNALP